MAAPTPQLSPPSGAAGRRGGGAAAVQEPVVSAQSRDGDGDRTPGELFRNADDLLEDAEAAG